MFRAVEPAALWLLLLLPVFWLLAGRLRLIPWGRRVVIVMLRTVMIVCLVLAVARLELRTRAEELSVFFLLDRSDSIPQDQLEGQLAQLKQLTERKAPRDETGVIAFGARPSMETSLVRGYEFEGKLLSQVEGGQTDIAAALRLGMAAFPSDRLKRLVLITDGNENSGAALEVARAARNNGIPIDVVPLRYDARNDVQVEKIVVPPRTAKDAPFDVKVFVSAQKETQALLRIFEDGKLLTEEAITVRPGRNPPLALSQRLVEGGFHTYTATIEAADDLRPQNNKAHGFTFLKAEPRVLIVDGRSSDDSRYLAAALRAENILVTADGLAGLPYSMEDVQRYDAIILSNVPAGDISLAQMQMIERGVHDLGIGLIMIGGEASFGAGGYMDTPVEAALPVSMDVKQKKVLPNGALVVVLHTCEIPSGNAWAKEVSIASLNVLSSQDFFGIVYFGNAPDGSGNWGNYWLWEPGLRLTGDKKFMRTKIKGVQPLDMPDFDSNMQIAAQGLIDIKAQTKHMVVISDGDPSPPSKALISRIRNAGITVSSIAIAPHNGTTVETLEQMAYWGSGTFYYPKTSEELPRIFTKEATVVRKSLIREETFTPKADAPSEVLRGFTAVPSLDGYVVTTLKDLAVQALVTEWDDPLLAHWRYGLGKSVAFTSDATNKWAKNWLPWSQYGKFWSQVVRWSLRETSSSNFQVNTEISGGVGRVTIDAVDDNGSFRNFLDFNSSVIGPDFQATPLKVRQVAPGRYEGTFPASQVGTYMLSMNTTATDGEDREFLTSGVALSYSPEYETSTSNDSLLRRIAESSGGRFVEDVTTYNAYLRNMEPVRRPQPLWPWLLLVAALVLPMDVCARRVYLSPAEVWAGIRKRLGMLLPRRETASEYDARMETLRQAKARAQEPEDAERQRAEKARAAFQQKLSGQAGQAPPAQGDLFSTPENPGRPAPRSGGKQTVTPDNEGAPPPPAQGGMGSLMEAKKRAQKRKF